MSSPKLDTDPTARLDNTLEAGKVWRYHAVPTVKPQNVAQHSWGVAVLALHICDGPPSVPLLAEALLHDTGELYTGDIPFTVKRDSEALKFAFDVMESQAREAHTIQRKIKLDAHDEALLKLCDTLEGFIWCVLHEDTRGPVGDRWVHAYKKCHDKFRNALSALEWAKADAVFDAYYNLKYNRNSTNSP